MFNWNPIAGAYAVEISRAPLIGLAQQPQMHADIPGRSKLRPQQPPAECC